MIHENHIRYRRFLHKRQKKRDQVKQPTASRRRGGESWLPDRWIPSSPSWAPWSSRPAASPAAVTPPTCSSPFSLTSTISMAAAGSFCPPPRRWISPRAQVYRGSAAEWRHREQRPRKKGIDSRNCRRKRMFPDFLYPTDYCTTRIWLGKTFKFVFQNFKNLL